VISERYLNESWDGVDELLVLECAISQQGERKLRGFLAAGGEIIYVKNPIGLGSEISLKEFARRY
jgi:hypothetical protein